MNITKCNGFNNINRLIKKVVEECKDEALKVTFIDNISRVLLMDIKAFLETKAIFIIVKIAENGTSLGYVLGDEGSGSYLGKKVIQY